MSLPQVARGQAFGLLPPSFQPLLVCQISGPFPTDLRSTGLLPPLSVLKGRYTVLDLVWSDMLKKPEGS